jgi:hypothetical protein
VNEVEQSERQHSSSSTSLLKLPRNLKTLLAATVDALGIETL